jgi:hypothetical protein
MGWKNNSYLLIGKIKGQMRQVGKLGWKLEINANA